MKLKYNILWIEDRVDVVDELIGPGIEYFLSDLGFKANITHRENGDELDVLIGKNRYDLILTDLNLGEGYETGEKVIKHIRDGNILTEVLLYSANTSTINEIVKNDKPGKLIERVSFAVGIENLSGKLEEIILLTIKKVQDVNNMRGLVIAETIDLENEIRDILKNYFEKMDDPRLDTGGNTLASKICEKKFEQYKAGFMRLWKVPLDEKALEHPAIIELIENDIFTIKNVNDAILSIFKSRIKEINIELAGSTDPGTKSKLEGRRDATKQVKGNFKDFYSEVIQVRNTLAHVKEEINEEGIPELKSRSKDGKTIVFNDEKYTEIRKNLRKHLDNLKNIQNNLLYIQENQF